MKRGLSVNAKYLAAARVSPDPLMPHLKKFQVPITKFQTIPNILLEFGTYRSDAVSLGVVDFAAQSDCADG